MCKDTGIFIEMCHKRRSSNACEDLCAPTGQGLLHVCMDNWMHATFLLFHSAVVRLLQQCSFAGEFLRDLEHEMISVSLCQPVSQKQRETFYFAFSSILENTTVVKFHSKQKHRNTAIT